MQATICDRCKKPFGYLKRGERQFTLRKMDYKSVKNPNMSRGIPFDLCPECYNELVLWITRHENDEK